MKRLILTFFMAAAVACAKSEPGTDTTNAASAAASAPQEITITSRDFTFTAPDTVNPGLTRIRYVNEGPNLHHAFLIRLTEGKTLADFGAAMQSMKPGDAFPSWAIDAGGPNPVEIGKEGVVTQELLPGNYALICVVDIPDKVMHVMKGMSAMIVVRDAPMVASTPPTPDVTMTLADYQFGLSTPLTAGKHVIKVDNAAAQPHEVLLFRLADGKTPEDFGKWGADYKGPPPGEVMGGVAPFKSGQSLYLEVDLTPGNYLLVCFVPDATDGKPHVEHGMIMPITIS